MSEYTKGEWTARAGNSLDPIAIEVPEHLSGADLTPTKVIAIAERAERFSKEGPANARLIASAPDMLEALKKCKTCSLNSDVLALVNKAINKATNK